MAESLLSGIAEGVLRKIATLVLQEAVAIYGVEKQISELRETLTAINAVLLDAEEQQAKNHRLQVWLDRLRDVLYDAEDVLDEFECEALRKQVISRHGGVKEKVCRFFSLSNPLILRAKLSDKIKEIRGRLSRISTEKDQFDLTMRSADNDVAQIRSREMTYSFVNKSAVIGRDIDKQKIIEMLLQSANDKNLSVIPIVGIGGLGKTTLTKLIYNDDSVKEHFKLRMWVYVPQDFDLKKTIEEIIKAATGQSSSNLNIQQLQTRLQELIKDKKYLLVLDDVWSNDHKIWQELRDLLSNGASESKVIVTTRSLEVASMMGTFPLHNLEGLSLKDSMALFIKWAFDEKEKQSHPNLLEIGNDIVKKSQGVPLVVKTLGSLLYSKYDERHWTHVRDSETWKLVEMKKDILPVLKLSYDHLPFHLKRCLATFSLLPREAKHYSGFIAWIWIALGFVSSTMETIELGDVAKEYMKELWKRSLIQEVEECEGLLTFQVHDLIHDLAASVAQHDCFIFSIDTTEIPEGVRYISLDRTSLEGISNFDGVLPFLRKPSSKKLRAIIQVKRHVEVFTREFARTCIFKCNSLRYLDLAYGTFEELPSSICNLKRLRLLNLRDNKRLKKLPNTICELQSLLLLNLDGCSKLGNLPKNMKRLSSLTNLTVTTMQSSLQESGIQFLENLHWLGIKDCQNLRVLFEGTCRLTHLRSVVIAKCEQVMELLCCLGRLACNLESFIVFDCSSLIAVPEWLPNHTRLKIFHLGHCPNLLSMPHRIQSLTALKELYIKDCGELSKRCEPQIGEDWQKIAHIPRIKLDSRNVQWKDD